jgi:hypothetical protein
VHRHIAAIIYIFNNLPVMAENNNVKTRHCLVSTGQLPVSTKQKLQEKYTDLQRRNHNGYFTDQLERIRRKINQIDNQQKLIIT